MLLEDLNMRSSWTLWNTKLGSYNIDHDMRTCLTRRSLKSKFSQQSSARLQYARKLRCQAKARGRKQKARQRQQTEDLQNTRTPITCPYGEALVRPTWRSHGERRNVRFNSSSDALLATPILSGTGLPREAARQRCGRKSFCTVCREAPGAESAQQT